MKITINTNSSIQLIERLNAIKQIDTIINLVTDYYRLKADDLISSSRRHHIVEARYVIFYMIDKMPTRPSWPEIASIFRRHHATCLHGVDQVHNWISFNNQFKNKFQTIQTLIENGKQC